MYRDNNLHLLIRATNHLDKQKIINSTGWNEKRYYLRREKAVHCGKKKQDLSPILQILYRCHDIPDLYLIN